MQKIGLIFFIILLIVSCDTFKSKEARTQQLVDEELRAIDWNEVDQYPLFENCDELVSKDVQRDCFQNTIMKYISASLGDVQLQTLHEINDTVYVDFLVDEHGFMSVQQVQESTVIREQLPEFVATLGERFKDLTTMAPALKQGIPVSMKFRLPIVLNTQN